MWAKFLSSELLWWRFVDDRIPDSNPSPPPVEYRAPSFSWASVDFEFIPGEPDDDGIQVDISCVKLQGGNIKQGIIEETVAKTEDIFGPIAEQTLYLRVKGVLKVMRLKVRDPDKNQWEVCVPGVATLEWPCDILSTPPDWQAVTAAELDFDLDISHRRVIETTQYYYIPWQVNSRMSYVMLLEALPNNLGRFRRLGLAFTSKGDKVNPLQRSQGNERTLPCWNYSKIEGRHIVYIV